MRCLARDFKYFLVVILFFFADNRLHFGGGTKMKWIVFLFACVTSLSAQEPKRALIFGVTGQDGAYLSEFLLKKGYEVHGVRRRASTNNIGRLTERVDVSHLVLHYGDVTDAANVQKILKEVQPHEVYNLSAQSNVHISFQLPTSTAQCVAIGTLNILEAIRALGFEKETRFYQASTSELFGGSKTIPQCEETPFVPRSPYAISKLFAYWTTVNYRDSYGMYACNGILFNHESPLRGDSFVTRKITQAIANITYGQQDVLKLGNLYAQRDWGFAGDYVEAMWLMLQQEAPKDYVVGTGVTRSVKSFAEQCCQYVGIDLEWQGEGINEVGIDRNTGKVIIEVDPSLYRPTEVDLLLCDPTKVYEELQWSPRCSFKELISMMMEYDIQKTQNAIRFCPECQRNP